MRSQRTYNETFLGALLFADDMMLIEESMIAVDQKLELWRYTLE
jgi:hypothetical protein